MPPELVLDRQDAVQDLIDHPTFESDFSEVAKGLGDLERIVSRIHAKNCKIKDFLKALEVRSGIDCAIRWTPSESYFLGLQDAYLIRCTIYGNITMSR